MKNIRMRQGSLEIATRTYYNEFTGRTMKLVGVCHIADPGFWDVIQETIALFEDKYPGAEVHLEGVDFDDPVVREANRDKSGLYRFCRTVGMEPQQSGLFREEHWHRTDLKLSQITARMKHPERLKHHLQQNKAASEVADVLEQHPRYAKFIRSLYRYLLLVRPPKNADLEHGVVEARNQHAISVMMTTGTDIITVWGAAHLHGMGKILTSSGYTLTDTEWNVCIAK